MPTRGCKSSYEVMTMGLIFAAVIILVTTTTEAREIRVSTSPPYRVTQKVSDLDLVDIDLRCSIILLGQ